MTEMDSTNSPRVDLTGARAGDWFATEGGGVAEVVEEYRVTHRYWRLGLMGSTLNDNDGWQSHARDGRCLYRLIAFYDLTHALPREEAERRRDVLAKLYARHQVVIGPDCRAHWYADYTDNCNRGVRVDKRDGDQWLPIYEDKWCISSPTPEPRQAQAKLTEADVGTWWTANARGNTGWRITNVDGGDVALEGVRGTHIEWAIEDFYPRYRRLTVSECRERGLPLRQAQGEALKGEGVGPKQASPANEGAGVSSPSPDPTEHERLAAFFFGPRDPGANILAEMRRPEPYHYREGGEVRARCEAKTNIDKYDPRTGPVYQ